jgi:hypothetical protein
MSIARTTPARMPMHMGIRVGIVVVRFVNIEGSIAGGRRSRQQ